MPAPKTRRKPGKKAQEGGAFSKQQPEDKSFPRLWKPRGTERRLESITERRGRAGTPFRLFQRIRFPTVSADIPVPDEIQQSSAPWGLVTRPARRHCTCRQCPKALTTESSRRCLDPRNGEAGGCHASSRRHQENHR